MKRRQARPTHPDLKRSRISDQMTEAARSGALAANNSEGFLNYGLSSNPAQTLLSTGAALGRATVSKQGSQVNSAIANTMGLTGGVYTNAAVNPDLFRGAIAPPMAEQFIMQAGKEESANGEREATINKMRGAGFVDSTAEEAELQQQPASLLPQVLATKAGDTDGRVQGQQQQPGDHGAAHGLTPEQQNQQGGGQGPAGANGTNGTNGDNGANGANGTNGTNGKNGRAGKKGDKGDRGDQGNQGDQGVEGQVGPRGDQGDQGDQGEQGDQGDQGVPGKRGPRGQNGADGQNGQNGQNAPGTVVKKNTQTSEESESGGIVNTIGQGLVKAGNAIGSLLTGSSNNDYHPLENPYDKEGLRRGGPGGRRLLEDDGSSNGRRQGAAPTPVNDPSATTAPTTTTTAPTGYQSLPWRQQAQPVEPNLAPQGTVDAPTRNKIGIGRYEHELKPYLPTGGSEVFHDTHDERHLKSLNAALFNSIIRDPETGDANINPLAMGLVIQNALRFSGDNQIFDSVFPGGDLNMGALPATTERLMIPDEILDREHCALLCKRRIGKRETRQNDHTLRLGLAAATAMGKMQRDIQWTNNNGSNRDYQHTAASNNTMPIEPEWWNSHRQDAGEVPLQANLLPAQFLQADEQFGMGYLKPSNPYNPSARLSINYNPSSQKIGWVPGNPFA
jgi:hypothetical protein